MNFSFIIGKNYMTGLPFYQGHHFNEFQSYHELQLHQQVSPHSKGIALMNINLITSWNYINWLTLFTRVGTTSTNSPS